MTEGFATLDFDDFHRHELPRRIAAGNGALAAAGTTGLGPLAFRLRDADAAWSYVPEASGIALVAGDAEAETVVELARESWEGLVHDLESAPGLLYGGFALGARGDMMRFVEWEPALRALYQGRPVYDPAALDLRGRDGRPLDPTASFTLQSDAEDMAHFLRTMGYVVVRDVFTADEIARFREEAEVLRERAEVDDGKSWWGRKADGQSVLCRVIHAGVLPALATLPQDPRLLRLGALADGELRPRDPGEPNGVTVLWKQPGVVEGLGDLPWHRDCGMGGHAVMCPSLVCSTFLARATAESGDLRFLPGSWRYGVRFADADDADLPGSVSVGARAGDVSLHYGDVVHGSPPPTGTRGPFRSCALTGFSRPDFRHHRGERHYNDVLLEQGGQVAHMRKVAAEA